MEALPHKRQAIAQGQQETVPLTRSLRASSEDYGGDPFEGFSTRDLEALERENPSTRRSSSGSGSFRGDVEEPPVSTNHRQRAGSEDSELEYVIPNALGETQTGGRIPRLQARLDPPADKRTKWPPEADLKVYSHTRPSPGVEMAASLFS